MAKMDDGRDGISKGAGDGGIHDRLRLAAGETRTVRYSCEHGRSRIEGDRLAEVLRTIAVAGLSYARRGSGGSAYDVYAGGKLVACVVSGAGFAYAFTGVA